MKEALVAKGPKVTIVDSPLPEPNDDQVLIKVVVSGSNPKDWKVPEWRGGNTNAGDDIAGIVVKAGANVTEFKSGDRVAAYHEIGAPHGSYAEYATAPAHTTFHIPAQTSFEDASTLPLVALTSAVGLHADLGLPTPWAPATEPIPLIVYGASSGVGALAVQLAKLSNIHPIIAVAGASIPFVEMLLDKSKGDVVVDYRGGDDVAVANLKKAVGDHKVHHALNAISEGSSNYIVSEVLQPGGTISVVLPRKDDERIKNRVNYVQTSVGRVHRDLKDFGFVYTRILGRALGDGRLKGHPYEVAPGGLGGIEEALTNLRNGKAHGFKYVFRIADTEGAGREKL